MRLSRCTLSLFLLVLSHGPVAAAQDGTGTSYEEWVEYRGGEVSLSFAETPINLALNVIRERTGVEFIIPTAPEERLLNLRVQRLALEPAVRSVISSLGFENFALIYDDHGQPSRVLVLHPQAPQPTEVALSEAAETDAGAPGANLSAERHAIEKELKRWNELDGEKRAQLEDRLRRLPPSEERAQLVAEYGRQTLGLDSEARTHPEY
jgi:hypothetical protein